MNSTKKLTQEQAIHNLKTKHPSLDFSKFVYVNNREKGIVIHPDGEEYLLTYKHLMRGITSNNNYTTERVVALFKKKFPESTCDYSKVEFKGMLTKVLITCPNHGDFEVTPNRYLTLSKYPCPKCGVEARGVGQKHNTGQFVESARVLHPNLDFSKTEYESSKRDVILICPDHGEFKKKPNYVLSKKQGCPKCSATNTSAGEKELVDFIKSLGFEVKENDRSTIPPKELDILIESKKIALEYNGLYFHSEAFGKGPQTHLDKTLSCEDRGIRLIHIFEDEWLNKKDIVKAKLKSILGIKKAVVYARNTKVIFPTSKMVEDFMEKYHIQGNAIGYGFAVGLQDATGEMVACMTFGSSRFEKNTLELIRFATSKSVLGGFSKLLKAFIRRYDGCSTRIVSYSDKRWSVGNVYLKNGFKKLGSSTPGYFYSGPQGGRLSRQSFMKHKLPKMLDKFDPNLTEEQNCNNNNYFRVWDCGMDKWELNLGTRST